MTLFVNYNYSSFYDLHSSEIIYSKRRLCAKYGIIDFTWGLHCSLTKEHQWAEHLTSLPKWGVGTLSSVSILNHIKIPMLCSQQLNALMTNNNIEQKQQHLRSQILMTQHSE